MLFFADDLTTVGLPSLDQDIFGSDLAYSPMPSAAEVVPEGGGLGPDFTASDGSSYSTSSGSDLTSSLISGSASISTALLAQPAATRTVQSTTGAAAAAPSVASSSGLTATELALIAAQGSAGTSNQSQLLLFGLLGIGALLLLTGRK